MRRCRQASVIGPEAVLHGVRAGERLLLQWRILDAADLAWAGSCQAYERPHNSNLAGMQ